MPLEKVFKNQSSAQDWIAEKLSLEPHMVHVNRVEVSGGKVSTSGRILLSGVKPVKFEFEMEL